jgi:hypothetical protein
MKTQYFATYGEPNLNDDSSTDSWNEEELKSPMLLGLSSYLIQDYVDRIINAQQELVALEQATYAGI